MATSNQDSFNTALPLTVSFGGAGNCIPAAIIEALQNARWWVNFPSTSAVSSGSSGVTISTLSGNVTRLDNLGAIYTPGIAKVELSQQTVTLTPDTAPNVPVDVVFSVPGVSDLQNTLLNIFFTTEPPGAPVSVSAPIYSANQIRYSVYRQDTGDTPPYDEIVVRGDGRVFVIPSPT